MHKADVLIVGAGAAGLMAARELSKAGKKVLIFEARDRIGGRIWPLSAEEFEYPAQGGAEFVHGEANHTKELVREAGLTYGDVEGEIWRLKNGELIRGTSGPLDNLPHKDILQEKLKQVKEDVPIRSFLDQHFGDPEFAEMKKRIIGMVEGYDAADPSKISTLTLREEWLGGGEWKQGRIKEGYGALLEFLKSECEAHGAEIILNETVRRVDADGAGVSISSGNVYDAEKVLITVPLPVLKDISFNPPLPEKLEAAEKIGFGQVVKLVLKFKERWWLYSRGQDLSRLNFLLSDNDVRAWWTQYPESYPVLVGWIPGPRAERIKNSDEAEIADLALKSLSETFDKEKGFLKDNLLLLRIAYWPRDPFAKGAYSYSTPESAAASEELRTPSNNKVFFAGEALYSGRDTATVEGALGSGLEAAKQILALWNS